MIFFLLFTIEIIHAEDSRFAFDPQSPLRSDKHIVTDLSYLKQIFGVLVPDCDYAVIQDTIDLTVVKLVMQNYKFCSFYPPDVYHKCTGFH